jgi:hypothetical protein
MCEYKLDVTAWGLGLIVGSFEHGTELQSYKKHGNSSSVDELSASDRGVSTKSGEVHTLVPLVGSIGYL